MVILEICFYLYYVMSILTHSSFFIPKRGGVVLHEKVSSDREVIVQDMYNYDETTTSVRCAVGETEGFEVKVGLHQGSALSPCLFAMVMDRMTDEISEEAPWNMMFADDSVLCSENNEQVH